MKQISLKDGRQNMGRVAEFMSLAVALTVYCPASVAQSANSANPVPPTSQFVAAEVSVPKQLADLVVREIDDPHSGARWLLMRNHDNPAGPGRLVLIAAVNRQAGRGTISTTSAEMIPPRPVIRAGDRLIVEENTAVIEARLEAVALGPATLGSTFDVRLKLGGKVARVVALAPGRAAFQTRTEVQP